MSDDLTRVEQLRSAPPTVDKTRLDKILDTIRDVCCVIAIVGCIVAFVAVRSSQAEQKARIDGASQLANCINNNLGIRNKPTADQTAAEQAKALADQAHSTAQTKALQLILSGDPKDGLQMFLAAETVYDQATNTYVAAMQKVAAERAANPLGKC